MTEPLVVGVDGGGTKTHAVASDGRGRVIGFGHAGPSNWEVVGLEGARANVGLAVDAAMTGAGVTPRRITASAFALAGCDWPSDVGRLDAELGGLGLAGPRVIVNDAYGALRAGARDGHGIASVAGTGGSTCGRNRAGASFRTFAISWGEACGASGLVRAAMHAIARESHGQVPPTTLTPRFVAALGVDSAADMFERMSRGRLKRVNSDLAPLVFAAAQAGDSAAVTIAREAGEMHGADTVGVARCLGMLDDVFEVVRVGGVHLAGDPSFDAAFGARIAREIGGATLTTLGTPPVTGAALLAFDAIGIDTRPFHDALSTAVIEARGAV